MKANRPSILSFGMKEFNEARSHTRYNVDDWKVRWASNSHYSIGLVRDVSQKGAFIFDDAKRYKRGDRFDMFIENSTGTHQVKGVVRWAGRSYTHRCYGIGVEFQDEQAWVPREVTAPKNMLTKTLS